jgi:SulP family sulfate permease
MSTQLADRFQFSNVRADVLSGLTVALALVPEAVAFALIAQVPITAGLYAAFMVGMITAVAGGRPGMISGATGALAVVMVALVAQHGVQYLFATVVVMGLIQMLAGVAKLGKFIRLVPHPVMLGFVNGLAIVIFLAQLNQFKVPDAEGVLQWMQGVEMFTMLAIVAATMAIITWLPKLTTAVPSALVAIVVASLATIALGLDTKTVGDLANIGGSLPTFAIPDVPFTLETLYIILPYAFTLAAIGLIESLLTMSLIDEMTNTHGKANRECAGQGIANVATGFFGGMGGCAMIGQSMININAGGRGRLSGFSAGAFLLCFILFASPLIERIPVAALIGVMFIVVIKTFEWSSFRILSKIPRHDAFVLILVSVVTVFTDLAMAVVIGVIVASLVFAWESAKRITVTTRIEENGAKVYELHGLLFFGSISYFRDLFDPANDPDEVTIEFADSRVVDHSSLQAIDALAERYTSLGKKLHLQHLSPECRKLLHKAGPLVEVNVKEDPKYHVTSDALD